MINNRFDTFLATLAMLVLLPLFWVSCQSADGDSADRDVHQDDEIITVFEKYWEVSKERSIQDSDELTTDTPAVYYECLGKSFEDCQKRKTAQSNKPDSNGLRLKLDDSSIGVTVTGRIMQNIPYGIRSGLWKDYVVVSKSTFRNEAKLSVEITLNGSKVQNDVLLYKNGGKWKIFDFVETGTAENYANERLK